MKVLVAYDGTLQSKEALKYGLEKVRETGGEVIALHVFNSNMFVGYDSQPWAMERARKESAQHIQDAKRIVEELGSGVRVRFQTEEGDPEEEIVNYAIERNADVLLCPPRYKGIIRKYKKILDGNGKKVLEDSILDGADKLKMAVVSNT